jgi:hypothetical protein
MAADPDWTDPCAVLAWLLPQYYRVLSGQQEVRILYAGRDTTYNNVNATQLTALKQQLEAECARKNGVETGRRRAIVAG